MAKDSSRQTPDSTTLHAPHEVHEHEVHEKDERHDTSISGLISAIMHDVSSLIRNEIQLGKAEMSQKVSQAIAGIVSLVLAGVVLQAGFLVLLAAAVYGLNAVLPPDTTPWLGALIVGVVVLIIGFIMLKKGQSNLRANHLTPDRTMESLQRDQTMAQQHFRDQQPHQEKTQ